MPSESSESQLKLTLLISVSESIRSPPDVAHQLTPSVPEPRSLAQAIVLKPSEWLVPSRVVVPLNENEGYESVRACQAV